jgi:hypothetical protein
VKLLLADVANPFKMRLVGNNSSHATGAIELQWRSPDRSVQDYSSSEHLRHQIGNMPSGASLRRLASGKLDSSSVTGASNGSIPCRNGGREGADNRVTDRGD